MEPRMLFNLFVLLCMCAGIDGNDESETILNSFLEDIITSFQFISPTIIYTTDEAPEICLTKQWLLCLENAPEIDLLKLAEHLDILHRNRKQDGIILAGRNENSEDIVTHMKMKQPTIFTSNCPVIMPLEYAESVPLRLDSNIIFYQKQEGLARYELFDKFAVKSGPPISVKLGQWDILSGTTLKESLNRWDRRKDLKGAKFVNAVLENSWYSYVTRDGGGNINGSSGLVQEMMLPVLKRLNLTVETTLVEAYIPYDSEKGNESAGYFGSLQRGEIDYIGNGESLGYDTSFVFDYLMEVHTGYGTITLVGARPKGKIINHWTYIRVFGIVQWTLYFAVLFSLLMALSIVKFCIKTEEVGSTHFGYLLSNTAMSYLFMLQMGSQPLVKERATRMISLTASILALFMFVCYTTDITAEMTAESPVKNLNSFEEVLSGGYKVIEVSGWGYNYYLRGVYGKNGSARHRVYMKYLENPVRNYSTPKEARDEVLSDTKTLMIDTAGSNNEYVCRDYESCTFKIPNLYWYHAMEDSVKTKMAFRLKKYSEFRQILNHHILRQYEHGILNMNGENNDPSKSWMTAPKEKKIGMVEPEPLGYGNTILAFIFLGIGICASLLLAIVELALNITMGDGKIRKKSEMEKDRKRERRGNMGEHEEG